MKAPSRNVEAVTSNLQGLVELYGEVNDLSVRLKEKKAELEAKTGELRTESKSVFDEDLGYIGDESAPKIYGNHEFLVGDHLITVNYKLKAGGLSFSKVGGEDAKPVLLGLMSEKEYESLFTETEVLEDELDQEKLREAFGHRPSLVGARLDLNMIPEDEVRNLALKYPEASTFYVKDRKGYIETVPIATVSLKLSTVNGFLEKAAKLSDVTKVRLADFLRKVLASTVESAVKIGNRADAK